MGDGKKLTEHRDAQAITYMTLLESCGIENRGTFELFFAQQMYTQMLAGKDPDIGQCIRRVVMVDSFGDLIRTHVPAIIAAGSVKKYNLDTVAFYNRCASIWGEDPSCWDAEPDGGTIESIAADMGIRGARGIGNGNRDDTRAAVRAFIRILGRPFVVSQNYPDTVVTVRSTLERFKTLVKEDLERLRAYYRDRFPAEPVIECSRCEYRSMCTAETEGGDDDAGSE